MPFLFVLIVIASVLLPLAMTVGAAWLYRRLEGREQRRSPIHNKRIHGAGEQLRKRVEAHSDEISATMALIAGLGPYVLAIWALSHVSWQGFRWGPAETILALLVVSLSAGGVFRIVKHAQRRRDAVAGLRAELFTAQELNRLIAQDCIVIHDVVGDGFNLDHVVIAPGAVYAVETKSFGKPPAPAAHDPARPAPDRAASDHFKVSYDGTTLRFPGFSTDQPIRQAERQTDWLRREVLAPLRLDVPVHATVALPGWWIDSPRLSPNAVKVFNPSGRGAHFMTYADRPRITPAQAGLIAQALLLRLPPET